MVNIIISILISRKIRSMPFNFRILQVLITSTIDSSTFTCILTTIYTSNYINIIIYIQFGDIAWFPVYQHYGSKTPGQPRLTAVIRVKQ